MTLQLPGTASAPISDARIARALIPATGFFNGRSQADWNLLIDTALSVIGRDADADALIARFTQRPDLRTRLLIGSAVLGLKNAGIWSKLDCLYVLGTNPADAALNWKSANYTLTTFGNVTYVPGQGFDGDGVSSHVNTNFNPIAAGGNYSQDSASFGVWVLEDNNENKDDIGNTNALIRTSSNVLLYQAASRLNTSSTATVTGTSTSTQSYGFRSSVGMSWVSRTGSAGYNYGRNAQLLGTVTAASVAPSNDSFFIGGGRISDSSSERVAMAFIGGGLTNAEVAQLYTVMAPVVQGLYGPDLYTLDLASAAQVLDGIGYELASDSIEGDAGGIQESNTASLPLDLSASERTRFATTIARVPNGSPFHNFRLAAGLYYRGISADGKNFVERLSGQNAAIADLVTRSGAKGITYCYWSPAPYWKRVTVGGTTYNGGATSVPDKVTNPSGFNTYLRNLLQGGTLDAPDKATLPTAYAAWMDDFANHVVQDLEYAHVNFGPVVRFCPQNEPGTSGATTAATYPQCSWTDQLMYDFLKAVVPKIRASAVLSSFGGQPNRVEVYIGGASGVPGTGSPLVVADSGLLAEIYGFALHIIDALANNAAYVRTFQNTLAGQNYGGKPVFSDENEYFDPSVTPGNAVYLTPQFRFANTCMMPLMWFVYLGSPIWYWIHIGKPTTGPQYESVGRALTVWKPPGSSASAQYPSLTDGTFTTVDVNWNAIKPWLRFLPWGSVRLAMPPAIPRSDVAAMAWRKPNGKIVIAAVNRTEVEQKQRIAAAGLSGSFARYRYTVSSTDQLVETVQATGGVDFTLPPWTAEFWEEQ